MFLTMTLTPLAKTSGVKSEKRNMINLLIYTSISKFTSTVEEIILIRKRILLILYLQIFKVWLVPTTLALKGLKFWPVQSTFRSIYFTIKRRPLLPSVHRNKWIVILNLLNKNLHSWLLQILRSWLAWSWERNDHCISGLTL